MVPANHYGDCVKEITRAVKAREKAKIEPRLKEAGARSRMEPARVPAGAMDNGKSGLKFDVLQPAGEGEKRIVEKQTKGFEDVRNNESRVFESEREPVNDVGVEADPRNAEEIALGGSVARRAR